jgi:hypothetical protein
MVARVKIQGGASSPFRVSVATVDVATAAFDQLIFDGDQMPFRIYANSYIQANLIPSSASGGLAYATQGPAVYATPSGQFPMFNVMWRIPDGTASDKLKTPKQIGGVINSVDGKFYGISYAKQSAGVGSISYAYCNYLIYKNYG